jgi:hypothetical protein
MPAKVTDAPTDYREIDRWAGGVGWIAHPTEIMERASHALATERGVWLVDPLDAPGVDDLVAEFGTVAGVLVLSNHHARDADVFARRHDVAVTLPESMTGVADTLDAPVERLPVGGSLGEYELFEVAHSGSEFWQEFALYDGETLVVSESVGGAEYMRVDDERLGVMVLRRLRPPTDAFGDLDPDRVVSGHGPGVDREAAVALTEAVDNARRRFPKALLAHGLKQVRTVLAAVRT